MDQVIISRSSLLGSSTVRLTPLIDTGAGINAVVAFVVHVCWWIMQQSSSREPNRRLARELPLEQHKQVLPSQLWRPTPASYWIPSYRLFKFLMYTIILLEFRLSTIISYMFYLYLLLWRSATVSGDDRAMDTRMEMASSCGVLMWTRSFYLY